MAALPDRVEAKDSVIAIGSGSLSARPNGSASVEGSTAWAGVIGLPAKFSNCAERIDAMGCPNAIVAETNDAITHEAKTNILNIPIFKLLWHRIANNSVQSTERAWFYPMVCAFVQPITPLNASAIPFKHIFGHIAAQM